MRTALFWVVTQRVEVISYQRFGTIYRSPLQGSRKQKDCILDPWKWYRSVVPKLRLEIATTVCVTTQDSAVLGPYWCPTYHNQLSRVSRWPTGVATGTRHLMQVLYYLNVCSLVLIKRRDVQLEDFYVIYPPQAFRQQFHRSKFQWILSVKKALACCLKAMPQRLAFRHLT